MGMYLQAPPKQKLFLSVYVDDFKMAGIKKNLAPMWNSIKTKLDLEPPVPFMATSTSALVKKTFPFPINS